MKILLVSQLFPPSVGGIESVNRLLCEALTELGHELTVVTDTAGSSEGYGYLVERQIGFRRLLNLARESELIWGCNLSLRKLPILILARVVFRKPVVISQHTWYRRVSGHRTLCDRLKRFISSWFRNVAVSKALAADLTGEVAVIENPYDNKLFRETQSERTRDLVFLGRLVPDKGVDTLIRSLVLLSQRSIHPTLTIIGDGPERELIRELIETSGLADRVVLTGVKEGGALVDILNRHKILVVPSRWDEPYGVVCLEGIACGLVVIGSSGGGLPEAIGGCGVTFRNRDAAALAARIEQILVKGEFTLDSSTRADHLLPRRKEEVGKAYERFFSEIASEVHLPPTNSVRNNRSLPS